MQNSQPDTNVINEQAINRGMIELLENKLAGITEKITELRDKNKIAKEKWDAGENARFEKWQKENDDMALEWLKKNPNGGNIFGGPKQPDPSPYPQFVPKQKEGIDSLFAEKMELQKCIDDLKKSVFEVPERYRPFNRMNKNQQEQLLFTSLSKKPAYKERSYYIIYLAEDLAILSLTGNEADGWATFILMTDYQARERKRQLIEQGNQVTEIYELDRRLVGFDPRNETAR